MINVRIPEIIYKCVPVMWRSQRIANTGLNSGAPCSPDHANVTDKAYSIQEYKCPDESFQKTGILVVKGEAVGFVKTASRGSKRGPGPTY